MSREALVLLVCCCDFRDRAERLIPSKSLRNAVIWAFPGLFRILRMCAPRRAAAVVRPREREKSADRRRRILISRLLIIRTFVPRRKSPFPAYFKGFPAVSPLIPPYPAFLKYPVSPHIPEEIEAAVAYFNENYNTKVSVDDYAESLHISTNWFIRNFKQYMKISPAQYILSLRMVNAQSLLENTEYNIGEIAEIVGYDNPLYFSRVFKKEYGVSPAQYRKNLEESTEK